MKANEQLVNVIMPKLQWQAVKLVARKLTVYKDGRLQPCTASDVVRELLLGWLGEKSKEYFPKLLAEAKAHDVQDGLTEFLEQQMREMEQE